MGEAGILHCLYTNAASGSSWDSPGARHVPLQERDAIRFLPPEVTRALEDLLRKTVPAGRETGWVVCRFAADGEATYACVIASHPDLVTDSDGRNGFLNHARLVRVSEASFDATALLELAAEFPLADVCAASDAHRLTAYVNLVGVEPVVPVRPVSVSELQALPASDLTRSLLGFLASVGRKERLHIALPNAEPASLCSAWAALPLALQRTSSWAVAVTDSCPVDAIFSGSAGKSPESVASEAMVTWVQRYVRLLMDAPENFRALLNNPNLSAPQALEDAVRQINIGATTLSSAATPGKGEMANKQNTTKANARRDGEEWQPVAPAAVDEMSRQLKAMEASLRQVIDERFAAWDASQRSQPRRQVAFSEILAGLWQRYWLHFLATLLAVAAVAVLAIMILGPPREPGETSQPGEIADTSQDTTPVPAQPETASQPSMTSVQSAVANGEASGQWAEELKLLLASDPGSVVRAISDIEDRVTPPRDASAALSDFAVRLARKETLAAEGAKGREGLRNLLVDGIAADVAQGAGVKVDGKLADVAPLMDELKGRLRVTHTSKDVNARDLQSEIILRWMVSMGR